MDFRFSRNERLALKQDFSRVFEKGRRFGLKGLSMWALHPTDSASTPSRLGLAIPKAYGNAVARNRLKRLLRESFRLNKNRLKSRVDIVFSARRLSVQPRLGTIEPIVLELWNKADLLRHS